MMGKTYRYFTVALLLLTSNLLFAAPPETLDYQGYLADKNGVPLTGTVNVIVTLYEQPAGGSAVWGVKTTVSPVNGRFSLILDGSSSGGNPFPARLFNHQIYVGLAVGKDDEMSPRQPLTSVPSAFEAFNAFNSDTAGFASNADTVDGLQANEIIDAASDEVRTPVSSLPFTITASGSYYMTQDLDGTTGGLNINAPNVTIDLMGFTMDGNNVSDYGIYAENRSRITIKNGTIQSFGLGGIRLTEDDGAGNEIIIENINVLDNGGTAGIYISGDPARIKNCMAVNNSGDGISTSSDVLIVESSAIANSGYGIRTGSNATLLKNKVRFNGSTGIFTSTASIIKDNTTSQNSANGISAGSSSVVSGNTAYLNNTGLFINTGGIAISSDSLAENNVTDQNRYAGILVLGGDSILRNNHATDSSTVNGSNYCFYFSSSDNAAVGNTATGCTTEFGGGVPPASRFINNIGW